MFGCNFGEYQLLKFKVGDTVTILKYKNTFTKCREANITAELFKVAKVICSDPNVYELKDLEDEPIVGKIYEEELSSV